MLIVSVTFLFECFFVLIPEIVKAACSNKLLQTWLRTFGGNVLELLKCLDVENSTETCELTLQNLFENTTVDQLVENFDLLNEK